MALLHSDVNHNDVITSQADCVLSVTSPAVTRAVRSL